MPKRKAEEEEEEEVDASQAPLAISAQIAKELASRLCRFVLLTEHKHKPLTRQEIKQAVMPEHNDRAGKIFKQVLRQANQQLNNLAGLEIVLESDVVANDDAEDAGASQAGSSQLPAGSSQLPAASQASGAKASAPASRYLVVNRLPEPVTLPLADKRPAAALYLAFVEVVLTLLQQSEGRLSEDDLFGWLEKLGLKKEGTLPQPADSEKVETLVKQRLVAEAYVRRIKKKASDEYEYVAGARAVLNRTQVRAPCAVGASCCSWHTLPLCPSASPCGDALAAPNRVAGQRRLLPRERAEGLSLAAECVFEGCALGCLRRIKVVRCLGRATLCIYALGAATC